MFEIVVAIFFVRDHPALGVSRNNSVSNYVSRKANRKIWKRYLNVLHVVAALGIAIIASYYTGIILAAPGSKSIYRVLGLFVGFTVSWGIFFHMLAMYWGKALTARIGNWWVKGIDYAYLTLSFAGLMRIVLQSMEKNMPLEEGLKTITVLAVLIIAVGVALRMTKTSIEIFKWDTP